MQTKEIKFSRNYKKLYNQKKAVLIERIVVSPDELSKEFVDYDTDGGKYKFNINSYYLLLYFIGNKRIPFTTLRKYNRENIDKYNSIGQIFKIVIPNNEEDTK